MRENNRARSSNDGKINIGKREMKGEEDKERKKRDRNREEGLGSVETETENG